ncbi:MAG: phosphoribosylformylglycinamidine synthase, partial [Rubripirellula sp.]
MPLWQIDIYPAENQVDREAIRTTEEIAELGLGKNVSVAFARGFLVQGNFGADEAARLAGTLLSDSITEHSVVAIAGQDILNEPPGAQTVQVNVLPKPGVMDPVAYSTLGAARDAGFAVDAVRTMR